MKTCDICYKCQESSTMETCDICGRITCSDCIKIGDTCDCWINDDHDIDLDLLWIDYLNELY